MRLPGVGPQNRAEGKVCGVRAVFVGDPWHKRSSKVVILQNFRRIVCWKQILMLLDGVRGLEFWHSLFKNIYKTQQGEGAENIERPKITAVFEIC